MTAEEEWREALQELHSVLIKNDGDVLSKSLESMSCSLRNSEKNNTYCNLGFSIEKVEFDSFGLSVSETLRFF